ncbi:MAG: outer membrane lipoprotein carrier protein LolA [Deltaproteobacteria bacterium]|jgi:outer membrane lipoprotein carrier protein|nr:outer membrane lipoprotein carrier protein LolA [Deltaproteobacteria bacterium]
MSLLTRVLFLGLLTLSLSIFGADLALAVTGEEILKGLSKRYQGLHGLSATYSRKTQTELTRDIFQNKESQATGQLAWREPAFLRLEQKSPTEELMVTDGSTVWWYLIAEKQVHIYRQLDLAGEMAPLLSFLTNLNELKKNFRVKISPDESDRPKQSGLLLDPRQKDSATGRIIAWCDQDFQLTGFDLLTVTGEKTSFYLTNVEPQSWELDQFSFTPPQGVKIIEESAN